MRSASPNGLDAPSSRSAPRLAPGSAANHTRGTTRAAQRGKEAYTAIPLLGPGRQRFPSSARDFTARRIPRNRQSFIIERPRGCNSWLGRRAAWLHANGNHYTGPGATGARPGVTEYFETTCPHCRHPLRVRVEYTDQWVSCKYCDRQFLAVRETPPRDELATIRAERDRLRAARLAPESAHAGGRPAGDLSGRARGHRSRTAVTRHIDIPIPIRARRGAEQRFRRVRAGSAGDPRLRDPGHSLRGGDGAGVPGAADQSRPDRRREGPRPGAGEEPRVPHAVRARGQDLGAALAPERDHDDRRRRSRRPSLLRDGVRRRDHHRGDPGAAARVRRARRHCGSRWPWPRRSNTSRPTVCSTATSSPRT